jgi:hypothetical protein
MLRLLENVGSVECQEYGEKSNCYRDEDNRSTAAVWGRICHVGAIETVYSIILEEKFGTTPTLQDCILDAGLVVGEEQHLQSRCLVVWEPNMWRLA